MAAQRRRNAITVGRSAVAAFAVASMSLLGACSGDDSVPVATLESDFPGDAFDAACELLERSEADDRTATVEAVLDSIAEDAGEETAVNTLELAVADRCPDWQDALDEALAARG